MAVTERLYLERLRRRDIAARVGLRHARIARLFRAATGGSVARGPFIGSGSRGPSSCR